MSDKTYIDERGYRRFTSSNRLVHRWIAEKEIYNPNKEDYKYPFNKYVVHHINGNKLDNRVHNLQVLTDKEHKRLHRIEEMKEQRRIAEERIKARESPQRLEFKPKKVKKVAKVKTVKKSPKRKKPVKYYCNICSRVIKHSGNCLPCNKRLKKEREDRNEKVVINIKKTIMLSIILALFVIIVILLDNELGKDNKTITTQCNTKAYEYSISYSNFEKRFGFFDYYGKGEVIIRNNEARSGSFTINFLFEVDGVSYNRKVTKTIHPNTAETFEAEIDVKRQDSFGGSYNVKAPTITICD